MNFDRLRIGDILCWDEEAIIERLGAIANRRKWSTEQFGCYLIVTDFKSGELVKLECAKDCGLHLTTEMTRDEYEEYYDDLGTDIFVFADSFADLSKIYDTPGVVENEDMYDFSRDSEEILKMISKGDLPMSRKRST